MPALGDAKGDTVHRNAVTFTGEGAISKLDPQGSAILVGSLQAATPCFGPVLEVLGAGHT